MFVSAFGFVFVFVFGPSIVSVIMFVSVCACCVYVFCVRAFVFVCGLRVCVCVCVGLCVFLFVRICVCACVGFGSCVHRRRRCGLGIQIYRGARAGGKCLGLEKTPALVGIGGRHGIVGLSSNTECSEIDRLKPVNKNNAWAFSN